MIIDDYTRDENCNTILVEKESKKQLHRETLGKYEYLTGEKLLCSNQKEIRKPANFTNSPLRKTFKKQIKTIEDQEKTS